MFHEVPISYLMGYAAIAKPGMKRENLYVVKASGEGNAHFYNVADRIDYSRGDDIYPDAPGPNFFYNQPNIQFTPATADAFASIETDRLRYKVGQTGTVTVRLNNKNGEATWLLSGATTKEELQRKLIVSIGDKTRGVLDIDWLRDEFGEPVSPATIVGTFKVTEDIFDLMTPDNRAGGYLRAKIYYPADGKSKDPNDMILWRRDFAYFRVDPIRLMGPGDFSIVYPSEGNWPSGRPFVLDIYDTGYVKLDYQVRSDEFAYDGPDQFVWESTDESVAIIRPDGMIIPLSPGTVRFRLVALNGGKQPVSKLSEEFTVLGPTDYALFVQEMYRRVFVRRGQSAQILWVTNLMQKLQEETGSPPNVRFDIELHRGAEPGFRIARFSATNATGFTIPGEYLTDVSIGDTPAYTVKISTPHPDPARDWRIMEATVHIVVRSDPVSVSLDKSMGQAIADGRSSLPIRWSIENFDPNNGEFELQVTRNGLPVAEVTYDRTTQTFSHPQANAAGGTYTLNLATDPSGASRLKDVYTVTIAARNAGYDWSRDSMVFHVYRPDRLKIVVGGEPTTRVFMSNRDRIRQLYGMDPVSGSEILKLNRHIYLNQPMRINYRELTDLGELTDQFVWTSSRPDVANVNVSVGGVIADVDYFGYSSYQPKADFILDGNGDGQTTITATHARTGLKIELDVTVETLKDKLYLFQFYPKTKTTVTYTNGDGEERKLTSDADGRLAVYEESGIRSDVYVTSKFANEIYTGVLDDRFLKTREPHPSTADLYPVNILQLRQLAKVDIYFKLPDGTPYTGPVTYRAGVYKNGYYCEPAPIGKPDEGVTEILGRSGHLQLVFDTATFYSIAKGEDNAADLSARDQIEFVVEVFFESDNRYYPVLLKLDGSLSEPDRVVVGEKIVTLAATQVKEPFMVDQWVEGNGEKASILQYEGVFGPDDDIPQMTLTTEIMLWGANTADGVSVEIRDHYGKKPPGQSFQTFRYPFSNVHYIRHVQILNRDTIWLKTGASAPVRFWLYKPSGELWKTLVTRSMLANLFDLPRLSPGDLQKDAERIVQMVDHAGGRMQNPMGDSAWPRLRTFWASSPSAGGRWSWRRSPPRIPWSTKRSFTGTLVICRPPGRRASKSTRPEEPA